MNLLKALLFDTRSIQRYVYSGNRLRANIGASYLVDCVFDEVLLDVLRKLGVDEDTWEKVDNPNWTEMDTKCRIGYIGGGNALVLFREDVTEEEIGEVVTEFTKRLLESHPGLRTGAAYGEFRIDADGHYFAEDGHRLTEEEIEDGKGDLTKLVQKLKQYQNSVFPETNVPYTGLTQLCPELGEAATELDEDNNRFYSREFVAKLDVADNAEKAIVQKIEKEAEGLLRGFAFPAELEKLGQKDTEKYIAIVHIDGNNMGVRFAGQTTLTARKNLSLALSKKTTKAFADMLRKAIGEYDSYETFLDLAADKNSGKKLLPVRPLVLGGDDMTFICTAKLALRYTKRVMEAMLEGTDERDRVDTCAGIAIQPADYPFFRGYMLAEQACEAAKKEMRMLREEGKADKSCWLDFVIRHGEQAPGLEEIRRQEYRTREGFDMHFGPYRADAADPKTDERALKNLTDGLDALKKEKFADQRLAMNKIKTLRDVVRHGAHEWEKYRQRLDERGDSLPKIDAWESYAETLWKDKRTPYIDLIEMLDYYEPEPEGGEANGAK